ncbi:MAG: baseplate J/gp47 family protein [Candidatus Marinimicrobia bacterium]|nr:baseplate J/gp47 family protein [Candidatus Neomarinimicrobiota bacterium]
MPAPEIPTTKEIEDRIVSDIESKISQSTPLIYKAFNRVFAFALSGIFTILYKFGQWAIKQIFTITQDADSLELKGDQYKIPRKTATAAILIAGFTGDNGTTIPAGTQFRGNSNGLLYSLQTTEEIAAGTASGNVLCLTAGESGNLINGSILTILQPIPGLNNQATISATVTEGEDQEAIEDYRARISEREKTPPQGGSLVDYILWAKEVPGITRAFAWGHREVAAIDPGYVSVYPLNDGEASRIPSAPKLAEVLTYIDDPTRAPMQVVIINVPAMIEKEIDIDVTALSPNTAAIRNAFAENVEAYLLAREPQQFIDQLDIKNVISRSGIEAIYINSGAQSVTLTIDVDAAPMESYELQYNELAILGTITGP